MCVCVCVFVWDSLEQVWGSEVAAGCFEVFGCVFAACGSVLKHVWRCECTAGGVVLCLCVCAARWTVWSRSGGVMVQQVALCCVFVSACAACGAVWSRFVGVSMQQVALCFVSVCVLRLGQVGAGLGQ